MNILVIGGLGYLGSDLCDNLKKTDTVTVLDCDLFNSPYRNAPNIELINESVCKFDFSNRKWDTIIICSDMESDDMYNTAPYKGYLYQYKQGMKTMIGLQPEAKIFHLTGDLNNMEPAQREYKESYFAMLSMHTKYQRIEVPELFGDNVVVRSDTYINEILHNFLVYEQHCVECDSFRPIAFQHIFEFTGVVCDIVRGNSDKKPEPDILPALMLANAVYWSLGEHSKYSLTISGNSAIVNVVSGTEYSLKNPDKFKSQLNMMVSAITQGITDEIFKPHNNRNAMIATAIASKMLNDKLTI